MRLSFIRQVFGYKSTYKSTLQFMAIAICATFGIAIFSPIAGAMDMRSAVKLAVKNHPTVHAQRANQRATAHELEESRRQFMPTVRVFGDIGKEKVDNPNSLSASDNARWKLTREIGVSSSLLLFDGFERSNIVYRNAARVDAAIYNLLASSETLALNAVEAYIDVVRHRNLVHIARKNIKRHEQIFYQIRQRVAGGKAPFSDRIQIEERVFAAKAILVEIQKASQDAQSKFRKIVGAEPGRHLIIPGLKKLPRSVGKLVSSSIANNYELKSAYSTISENVYNRDASESVLAPRLSLESSTSYGVDRGGSSGDEFNAYVGLKLAWKVFDGGVSSSRSMALEERVSQAKFLRDVKVRDIRELAERSWTAYVQGRKRNGILRSQVKTNRRIVKNYVQEYELSKRSLLDVLDAERARFNSQFQQIGVQAAYQFAGYRMLATMSKLASHFGIEQAYIAPQPYTEERFVSDPAGIFKIDIEPLK